MPVKYLKTIALSAAVIGLMFLSVSLSGCQIANSDNHNDNDQSQQSDAASQKVEDEHAGQGHSSEIEKKHDDNDGHDSHEGQDHGEKKEPKEEEVKKGHEGHDHSDNNSDEHEGEEGIHLLPQSVNEAGIVVESLRPRMLTATLELTGTVLPHPQGEGFVGSLAEGRIKEIFVDVGDCVSAGDALCIIETPAVGEAEASFITASAELEYVRGDLERHKILVAEGIGSQKELLELQALLSSSSSAVSAAERTLHAYGFNEEDIKMLESNHHTGGRVTLRSPITGNVIMRDARIGMQVKPESDMFHIVDLKKLRIHVDIPEQRINDVSKGIEVTIISQNGHLSELKGLIDRIGESIEYETRTLPAFVTVDNSSGKLRPGAFVTVRLAAASEVHQVLAVPLDAVFTDKHGDIALFVESEEGEFMLREVETGKQAGGWIQIVSGVLEGERVVTKGAFAIKSEAEKSGFSDGCSSH